MASVKEPRPRRRDDDVDLGRDRSLVERCQAGDEAAFEDLYLRYRDRLYRYCMRRLDSPAEAEDIVQEAFARAWKALPRFNGEMRFYPWLSVIANNLCIDLARRGSRFTPVEETHLDLLAPPVASEQEARIDLAGEGQLLAAALNRISPRHREVLELREGRNWSYQEIATHSGVEVSTIETLLFRARRSLKREFMTLARAEAGVAGVIAFPLVALRGLFRKIRHASGHSSLAAKLTAAVSQLPLGPVVGGAAVAATATALTVGAVVGSHPGTSPTAAVTRPAATARSASSTGTPGFASKAGALRAAAIGGSGSGLSQLDKKGATSAKAGASGSTTSPLAGGASSAAGTGGLVGGTIHNVVGAVGGAVSKTGGGLGGVKVTNPVPGVSTGVSGVTGGLSGVTGGLSGVTGGVSGITSGLSGIVSGVSSIGTGGLP